MAEYVKGKEYDEGIYLGERINEAGLIVQVFDSNGTENEYPLPDEEQAIRRTPRPVE